MREMWSLAGGLVLSGDFVKQGKAEEFEQLEQEVLGPLWDTLKEVDSGNAVLLAVPGNHDLERPDLKYSGELKSALRWMLKPELFHESSRCSRRDKPAAESQCFLGIVW